MIGAKRVTAPDGTTWQVGRRWLPDKPTLRRRKDRDNDHDDPTGGGDWLPDFGFDEAFAFVLVILAAVLSSPFSPPSSSPSSCSRSSC